MEMIMLMVALMLGLGIFGQASDLKLGDPAPVLKLKTDEGASFDLNYRKGQWTGDGQEKINSILENGHDS